MASELGVFYAKIDDISSFIRAIGRVIQRETAIA
jgi:hypothetical protein